MGFKFVPYQEVVCAQAAENTEGGLPNLSMSSTNNADISTTFTQIQFASYGTPTGQCGAYNLGGCHAGNSVSVVQSIALGTTAFTVGPNNQTFGDPCRNTYKRLYVQALATGTRRIFVPVPVINSFSANPNPQTSGSDGTPNYNTTLNWTSTDGLTATITSSAGETFNITLNGSINISNLSQSTAGSNSPATRNYTLRVVNELNEASTSTITVSVFNDNVPNNYTLPNQTNLAPNTLTTTSTSIFGIDMITTASAGPGVQVSNNNSNWSSTTSVTNGNQIFARASSPPFNTDPSGLTNSSQFYIDVGPLRRFFTLTTRAPDVNETFNYPNFDDKLPFPDIDTIPGSPDPYISTNTLSVDDIEIPVEIKTNNSNIQIRVKRSGSSSWENWQDTRSI